MVLNMFVILLRGHVVFLKDFTFQQLISLDLKIISSMITLIQEHVDLATVE